VRVLAQTLYDEDELHGDVVQRYDGMLFIDDDEGDLSLVWYLKDGAVLERTQHHAVR
jgi:hypothetical protein